MNNDCYIIKNFIIFKAFHGSWPHPIFETVLLSATGFVLALLEMRKRIYRVTQTILYPDQNESCVTTYA